ncbi:hypothetical protein TSUD_26270 [Trifolium subterraneum]|uniref:Sec-independent protein translocase protein TatB n=1 Tax=Trifolium subterraneum TaxID=3900 RepID=A0A2Z6NXZ8_TRISU|nr:hypothetical protein TSUD_26270 [Trifolium subterraneum]
MLGFSYGELFLLLGATAALIGPKDLPIISRTAGRLAGRAIGYVQLARGQFESVMQQYQARQVHKELQDTMAQLDAIRHEIRSLSFVNPGPLTRRLNNCDEAPISNETDNRKPEVAGVNTSISSSTKDSTPLPSNSLNMQSQSTTYARLAEAPAIKNGSLASSTEVEKTKYGLQLIVMPVSAENTGFLLNRGGFLPGFLIFTVSACIMIL